MNGDNQADPSGLLWWYRLDGQGGGTRADHQAQAEPGEAFDWMHIQCDAPGMAEWLVSHGFSEALIDNLLAFDTRPRTIAHSGGTLVMLRGVNLSPGADPEDMVSIRVWFNESMVVTARKHHRRLLSVQDVREAVDCGDGPRHPGELVALLVERLADRIGAVVDEIDEALTTFETTEFSDIPGRRRDLRNMRRQSASIRRYLAPQREALDTLYRMRGVLSEQDAHVLREQTDRTTRYVEDLDLAKERALVLQEELQSRVAEQQNARMYVLSIVAAIFLPLSYLTGVFGMNVAGLPGTEHPYSFWLLMAGMATVGACLLFYMKRRKWL